MTNGYDWIFLILKDSNGDGAIYVQSLQQIWLMTVIPHGVEEISRTTCDLIARILEYWVSAYYSLCHCPHSGLLFLVWSQVEHSNKDIGDDDWFLVEWE